MIKVSKKIFFEILDFLSGFGGFTDLDETEMKEELWEYYKKDDEND